MDEPTSAVPGWFVRHARSPHALAWLALVAFADAIFLPIAPEVFLVALMLAHPARARQYLAVALLASVAGAAVAYTLVHLLFAQFGEPLLAYYGAHQSFIDAQRLVRGHVFWTMAIGNFSPIPDKLFIYAGGLLGVRFIPFITGYFVGRGLRMSIAVYITDRYGSQALVILRRYMLGVVAAASLAAVVYAMVHWHLIGLS